MTSLICKYSQIQSMQKQHLKCFHGKSCEFYCKDIKFMIIKVLTATGSNTSHYVYVK